MLDFEDIIQNTSDQIMDKADKLVYGIFDDLCLGVGGAETRVADQALVELSMKVTDMIDRATDLAADRTLELINKLHNMSEQELVEHILKNPDDIYYVLNPSKSVHDAHNFAKKL